MLSCLDGKEEKLVRLCKEKLDKNIIKDVFVFSFEQMKRYQGAWHLEQGSMVPGSVFIESEDGEALRNQIKQCQEIYRHLHKTRAFREVNESGHILFQELCGQDRCMHMSRGVIRNGITQVTEGPLKEKERLITRIDRHKRLAFLDKSLLPAASCIMAGLEITEKTF